MSKYNRFLKKIDIQQSRLDEMIEKEITPLNGEFLTKDINSLTINQLLEKVSKQKSLIKFDYTDIIKSSKSASQRKSAFDNFTAIIDSCLNGSASDIETFLRQLSSIQQNIDKIGCTDGALANNVSRLMVTLQFVLILKDLINSWESQQAGFAFEGLLALGLNGQRVPPRQAGFSVIDLVIGDKNYSVKFVKDGKVIGSMKYLAADMNLPIISFPNRKTVEVRPPGSKPIQVELARINQFKYERLKNTAKTVDYVVGLKQSESAKFYHVNISPNTFNDLMKNSKFQIKTLGEVFGKKLDPSVVEFLVTTMGTEYAIFADKGAKSKFMFTIENMVDLNADISFEESMIQNLVSKAEEETNISMRKMEEVKTLLDSTYEGYREFASTFNHQKGREVLQMTVKLEEKIRELIKEEGE